MNQHRRSRDVLASAIEDRGLLAPFVVMDAVMHVEGPPSGSPAFAATSLFLFESLEAAAEGVGLARPWPGAHGAVLGLGAEVAQERRSHFVRPTGRRVEV